MKLNLANYVQQINDTLTTQETINKYSDFTQRLNEISSLTEKFYTPDANGTYPLLTAKDKNDLYRAYDRAIKSAHKVSHDNTATGEVGERMKKIAKDLMPMLSADNAALEITDVEKTPYTLPALIGNARTTYVELGKQKSATASGNVSTRHHLKVKNGNTIEEGYFTPTATVDILGTPKLIFDRLEDKYPPQYKPILDKLRKKSPADLASVSWDAYRTMKDFEKDNDVIRFTVKTTIQNSELRKMGVTAEDRRLAENQPDYAKFIDELASDMNRYYLDYRIYKNGEAMQLGDGANIDKRNIGMSRVSKLLGKPDLVAEARPMIVSQDGKAVSGTFMSNAYGTNVQDVKHGDAILDFGVGNLDNPAVFEDIAAMQALDFICGNVDRHEGNIMFRFDDPNSPNAKLIGITLIDNDMAFGPDVDENYEKGARFITPDNMGVIGRSTYESMKAMTYDQLDFVLRDCGLSKAEIDAAWKRKEYLQNKIEQDQAAFQYDDPGITRPGLIRIVEDDQWENYSLVRLANTHRENQFDVALNIAGLASQYLPDDEEMKMRLVHKDAQNKLRGIDPKAKQEIPVGVVVGSGVAQEADPLNIGREETVHLVVPNMAQIQPTGAKRDRYPVSYLDPHDRGRERNVFITLPNEFSANSSIDRVINKAIAENPNYSKQLTDLRNHYRFSDDANALEEPFGDPMVFPTNAEDIPYRDLGWKKQEFDALKADPAFCDLISKVSEPIISDAIGASAMRQFGIGAGQRIELRSVAMSEVSDVLGVSNLVVKSNTAEIMCGVNLTEAVITDQAKGIEFSNAVLGSPMAKITAEQAKQTYNDPRGLKSLADLQALDYICLKTRSAGEMAYQFEGLDTDAPKLVGVQGTENEFSFGTGGADAIPMPKVISESMANSLAVGGIADKIAEKMQKNGMNEAQTAAARQRIEAINASVRSGATRVVKDNEWGQGQNTMEELAKAEGTIFKAVNDGAIFPMAEKAARWNSLPKAQQVCNEPAKINFTRAARVDGFGDNITDNAELDKLSRQAEKDFNASIEAHIIGAEALGEMSSVDLVRYIKENADTMKQQLSQAAPFLSGRSKTYKDLQKAVKELHDLSKNMLSEMTADNTTLKVNDPLKLQKAINKVRDCSSAYTAKKAAEAAQGQRAGAHVPRRLQTCESIKGITARLNTEYTKTLLADVAAESPIGHVHDRVKRVQEFMNDKQGDALRTTVAQEIYFKGLESSSLVTKSKTQLLDAMSPKNFEEGVNKIKQSPAFEHLASLPDDRLKALAQDGDGGRLMDSFFRESAKIKQKEIAAEKLKNRLDDAIEQVRADEAGKNKPVKGSN